MMQAIGNQYFEPILETLQRQLGQKGSESEPASQFAGLFRSETKTAASETSLPARTAVPTNPEPQSSPPTLDEPAGLGSPNVQAYLNSYYAQADASSGGSGVLSASTPYEPPAGAAPSNLDEGLYGPDAIYAQALANQSANNFAASTGLPNVAAQLPGIPSRQAQQAFDQNLAYSNAERLLAGDAIDTAAYWSDPGSITIQGKTFSSAQLGYAGPGQSSGPEPIFISDANQRGPDTFTVPGYSGTVTGIQPGHFYTLQQLEQAGLKTGQPDAQFVPGSWSTAQTS